MTLGAASGSRRRSTGGPANVIGNGTFGDSSGWSNIGFSGKSVTGGKLVFAATPAYDAAFYNVTVTPGSYYEMTYTISGYSSGNIVAGLFNGTNRLGAIRTANGTYVERLLANTGNTQFGVWTQDVAGTFSFDDVSLIGPYTTATVGGA